MYKILMGGLVPRPIAFVSTITEKTGRPHLSPFSMVQIVSIQPLVLMLTAPRPSPAHVKQTMESITRLKQFTINVLSNSTVGQQLGSGVPFYVEEWIERGVIHWTDSVSTSILSGQSTRSNAVSQSSICAPRIAESAFSLECELFQPPKDAGLRVDPCVSRANIILGVMKRLYVRSDVLNSTGNMVDPAKLDPVLRLNVDTL
jgi:flavin reductase (DIM6/NTAB) family NADH-FMN oxidoreductase RutF